jgi:formylglycine-generating enzyme required for sulfatase activity
MLVDFGLAKLYNPQSRTTVGARAVTPGFAPFEQYGQGTTDARTDVYALGATIYTLVTGQEPPESIQRLVADQLTPPRALNPHINPALEAALLRALQVHPSQRFQSTADFRTVLRAQPAPPPPTRIVQTPSPTTVSATAPTPPLPIARLPLEPEMVLIPAGLFWMGSDGEEDASPRHQVELWAYYIGKYPVTNAEYLAFVRDSGYSLPTTWKGRQFPSGKERHPVTGISWLDAVAYCQWLAKKTGRPYRLLTEAEWEKAARGTDGRIYPWGNTIYNETFANCDRQIGGTTAVDQYPKGASPYDVLDMMGNVWEWCADWYDDEEYSRRRTGTAIQDPRGPAKGLDRVIRGGSWADYWIYARCVARHKSDPKARDGFTGFRVARSHI